MRTQRTRYGRWVDDGPESELRFYPMTHQRDRHMYGIEFMTTSGEPPLSLRRKVILTGEEIARITKLARDCGLLPEEPI